MFILYMYTSIHVYIIGMAYRITDISEKPAFFRKYRISVSVKIISVKYRISAIDKISDFGWAKISAI